MLKSRIPQITVELEIEVDHAIVSSAHEIAEAAERRLEPHRDTGELALQVNVNDRKREGVYVLAGDPKDPSFAFYGHMLEHGTSHSPPYPFLVPALEENRESTERRVRAALGRL